jgi:hypothetical protein
MHEESVTIPSGCLGEPDQRVKGDLDPYDARHSSRRAALSCYGRHDGDPLGTSGAPIQGHEADKTGMGLIVRVHFAIRQSPLARPWSFQVIAAYLPPKPGSNPGINTMWSKLQSFIAAGSGNTETHPRRYLESKVTNWIHKSLAQDELTILLGDLNGVLDPGVRSRNITEFVRSNGLKSPFTDILLPKKEFHTFYRQEEGISRVDHIPHSPLSSGVSLGCLGVHAPVCYEPAFDHRPLFLGIHFGDSFVPAPPAPDTVRAPRADIRAKDQKCLTEFAAWTDDLAILFSFFFAKAQSFDLQIGRLSAYIKR